MRVKDRLFVIVTLLSLSGLAHAEKPNMSPDKLRETATHVLTGQVMAIYTRVDVSQYYETTKYLAEVRVDTCEKGDGIEKDQLVYVRYWRQKWIGEGPSPPGTAGHRGIPQEDEVFRVYVAQNAYDGFDLENNDGGFNVIGANGFQLLKKAPEK